MSKAALTARWTLPAPSPPGWRCTWPKARRVLVWATCTFTEPLYNYTFTLADGSWPYSNSHCLVLTGYDEDNYYFADPMQEITEIDRDTFALRYEELGSHAVVITQ